jgi:hypothetical protein
LEVHGPDEISDMLRVELEPPVELSAASSSAALTHSRPQRPGKGKTVVKKFQADV